MDLSCLVLAINNDSRTVHTLYTYVHTVHKMYVTCQHSGTLIQNGATMWYNIKHGNKVRIRHYTAHGVSHCCI